MIGWAAVDAVEEDGDGGAAAVDRLVERERGGEDRRTHDTRLSRASNP
jgi:hypothetical protein